MTHSNSIKSIMQAIQNLQQTVGKIDKNAKGQVGSRNYGYSNLAGTWDAIAPLLMTNKLVVTQSPTIGQLGQNFTTTIYHLDSEEWIQESMPLILQRDDPQGIGSAITYYRRYMLTSMLGLIPDDDNDAKDHRLATSEQKLRLVGAVKQVVENATPDKIVSTIMDITGKHPKNIREDEAEKMIELVLAFADKK